jgi:glycosyltransferase involved in cell wall biosynthesis
MPDVTVIIPCYNGRRFIGSTIESVLNQTLAPRQVLVIDDGSTDGSAAVVQRYVGDVVQLIEQENAGESRARNVGIDRATCEYIALLDADDLWLPQKLERQVDALERDSEAVGVHTRVFNFNERIDDRAREETERTMDDPSVRDLIEYHHVTPSSLLVRASILREHDIRFDETTQYSEDMLFAADLRLAGRLRLVDEPLTAKRVHDQQQSRDPWHRIRSLQSRVRWLRKRREPLGELAAELETDLRQGMLDMLEDRFWRRQLQGFENARAIVADLFPDVVQDNKIMTQHILPSWVYRLRDRLSGR